MMASDPVGRSLALRHAHARLRLALDDAPGTWHGIGLAQFAMLARVAPPALPA